MRFVFLIRAPFFLYAAINKFSPKIANFTICLSEMAMDRAGGGGWGYFFFLRFLKLRISRKKLFWIFEKTLNSGGNTAETKHV